MGWDDRRFAHGLRRRRSNGGGDQGAQRMLASYETHDTRATISYETCCIGPNWEIFNFSVN